MPKGSTKPADATGNEALEQLLTCPVCLEVYKDPVILPCHHTLCKRCLDCLKKANNYFMCPCCKGLADAKKIKRDFRMRSLLELHMIDTVGAVKSSGMTTSCEVCHKNAIEWKCVECNQYICHDCKINHQSIFVCRNHTLETLESCASGKKHVLEEASIRLHDLEQECVQKKTAILSKAEKLHDVRSSTLNGIVESKNEMVRRVKEHHTALCQRAVHILAQEECNLNTISSMIDTAIDGIRHKKTVLDNLIMSNDNASLIKCADDLNKKVMAIDISDLVIGEMQSDLSIKLQKEDLDFTELVKLNIKKSGLKSGKTRSRSAPAPENREGARTPTGTREGSRTPTSTREGSRTPTKMGTGSHGTSSAGTGPGAAEVRRSTTPYRDARSRSPSPSRARSPCLKHATTPIRSTSPSRAKSLDHRSTSPLRASYSFTPVQTSNSGATTAKNGGDSSSGNSMRNSMSKIPISTNSRSKSAIKGIIKESANKSILKKQMTQPASPTIQVEPPSPTELSSSVRLKARPSMEIDVNPQLLRTFTLIENNIWCVYLDAIEIYNQEGKIIQKIKHHNMVDARAVTKAGNGHIVVACGSSCGLLQFESSSKMDAVVGKSNGSFCDVTADKTYMYGLDYRETKVLIFKYLYNKWMPVRRISLAYWNGSARDTLLVHDENVFVCSYTNAEIYQYDQYGILLGEFTQHAGNLSGQITMPSLCYVDEEMEAVVVSDTTRHTIHTVSYAGRVGDLHLPPAIKTPHRVVQDPRRGSLYVLEYTKLRIVKLSAF